MRKLCLSAVLTLMIVAVAALAAWAATASFTPPPEPGNIFAVINFDRSGGANQPTRVSVSWGEFNRSDMVGRPYGNCSRTTPAGIVLLVRHAGRAPVPFHLTTNGTIVRGPYQGEPPPEISHACYRFLRFRARQ
jgi:hypothetical protein